MKFVIIQDGIIWGVGESNESIVERGGFYEATDRLVEAVKRGVSPAPYRIEGKVADLDVDLMNKQLQDELAEFCGTEHFYQAGKLTITDGVKFLVDRAACYWLLDIIASYQSQLTREPFQVWELKVSNKRHGVVTADDGNGNKLVRQEIPSTDFPLDYIKLYCADAGLRRVVMLPNEY